MRYVIRWGSTHHADTGDAAAQCGQNAMPLSFNFDVGGLPCLNVKLQCSIRKQRMLLRAGANKHRYARVIGNNQ